MKVYALVECDVSENHTHSIYESKRAAYKSMLLLVKKRVNEALCLYRLTGDSAAEYCYRNHSHAFYVIEEEVWTDEKISGMNLRQKTRHKDMAMFFRRF